MLYDVMKLINKGAHITKEHMPPSPPKKTLEWAISEFPCASVSKRV